VLADECSDLVVAPSKGLIFAMGVLKSRLEEYIKANSNPEISKKALEGAFCAADAVVRDRFLLLDALVGRCSVANGPIEPPDDKTRKDLPFRSACRGFIENALAKAAAIMDLSQDPQETGAFSRFKAWEIEEALFQEFQGELGNTRMSKQYLEQAKALKRGLEDPENTTLCLRILAEDISAKCKLR
jgi:Transcription factor S-II (TFIIS), central domain